jgi:ABC-type dipeptide/oligopeptide/nickel transport system permease component
MFQYTIRRILYSIPVLIGILVVTFVIARSIPGDPCKAMLGEKATAEVCERFNREQGFDQPIPVQFWIYMNDILRGDFGESIRYSRPVTLILIERLPMTIELGILALLLATLVAEARHTVALRIPAARFDIVSWLHRDAEILREESGDLVRLEPFLALPPAESIVADSQDIPSKEEQHHGKRAKLA